MKATRILFPFLFLLFAATAESQVLKAGVNLANISITNDGDVDDNKALTSFQAGFSGDLKLAGILYLQPGILFTGKGSKTSSGDPNGNTWYKATTNPMYMEVPVNLVLKTPGKDLRFFAGAGPYLGIGIAGKNKVEGKFLGTYFKSEENIKWSDDDPSTLDYEEGAGYGIMKRFDYGLNFLAGIEFSKTVLSLNYGHGLAKLQSGSNSSADDKNKHRVLSLTLGFKLN
ncbi:MAG: porin family protein [Chitinophagaceae bacterium]